MMTAKITYRSELRYPPDYHHSPALLPGNLSDKKESMTEVREIEGIMVVAFFLAAVIWLSLDDLLVILTLTIIIGAVMFFGWEMLKRWREKRNNNKPDGTDNPKDSAKV